MTFLVEPTRSDISTQATCSVLECEEPVVARGWCRRHWSRWYRTGEVHQEKPGSRPPAARPVTYVVFDGEDPRDHEQLALEAIEIERVRGSRPTGQASVERHSVGLREERWEVIVAYVETEAAEFRSTSPVRA